MQITCPNSQFTQDVPEEKIPPGAEQATCPKCRHKFKFRDLSSSLEIIEEPENQNVPQEDRSIEKNNPFPKMKRRTRKRKKISGNN